MRLKSTKEKRSCAAAEVEKREKRDETECKTEMEREKIRKKREKSVNQVRWERRHRIGGSKSKIKIVKSKGSRSKGRGALDREIRQR